MVRAAQTWLLVILPGVALTSVGCGDSTAPGSNGTLQIVLSTSGAMIDRDPDGYDIILDGQRGGHSSASATTTFDVAPGRHAVEIDGVTANCLLSDAKLKVDVVAGKRSSASFNVVCVPNLGSLRVMIETSGAEPDADGYSLTLAEKGTITLPLNGTVTIPAVRAGVRELQLSSAATNCIISGVNPRPVVIPFAATVETVFHIACVGSGGVKVTTHTSGSDPNPAGYTLSMRPLPSSTFRDIPAPANGIIIVDALPPGPYQFWLRGAASNCGIAPPSVVTRTIAVGETAEAEFDARCSKASQLAFVSGEGMGTEIGLILSTNTGLRQITSTAGRDDDPAWSPDGTELAFTSERSADREIYVMQLNGTDQTRITNSAGADYRPTWSPDGRRIAFVSERDGNAEIYVMSSDGTNPVRLTSDLSRDSDPSWSPDGNRIAFYSERNGSAGIWLMNADGSSQVRLVAGDDDRQPAWSPDGRTIVFTRASGTERDLFLIGADGSGLRKLTSQMIDAADPSWSPDGRMIVFSVTSCTSIFYYDYCFTFINTIAIFESTTSTPQGLLKGSNPAWQP